MQIPNNPNNPQQNPYNPQQNPYNPYPQFQYPPQQYTAQQPVPYQLPKYVKPAPPPKKPAPFSFEPGSNKELDDALNSIDNMYNDMFDTVDNQKQKQETSEQQQEFCIGIPVEPFTQQQQYQQYQNQPLSGNVYQCQQKWQQYTKDSNSFY